MEPWDPLCVIKLDSSFIHSNYIFTRFSSNNPWFWSLKRPRTTASGFTTCSPPMLTQRSLSTCTRGRSVQLTSLKRHTHSPRLVILKRPSFTKKKQQNTTVKLAHQLETDIEGTTNTFELPRRDTLYMIVHKSKIFGPNRLKLQFETRFLWFLSREISRCKELAYAYLSVSC